MLDKSLVIVSSVHEIEVTSQLISVHVEDWCLVEVTLVHPVLHDLELGYLFLPEIFLFLVTIEIVLASSPVFPDVAPLPPTIELPHL